MRKKERKLKKTSNKGITLIALVITIIVLLILAGVSIATLTGDNGILTKAQTAKEETTEAQERELLQLAYVAAMDTSNGSVASGDLQTELNNLNANATASEGAEGDIDVTFNETNHKYTIHQDEGEEGKITGPEEGPKEPEGPPTTVAEAKLGGQTFSSKTTITDDNGENVPVPGGFKIAGDSATDVENGVVIEDTRETTKGSQFVWIPVTDENQYVRDKTYTLTDVSEVAYDDTGYLPDGIDVNENESEKEKETVTKAGGFYIGRFEAGKEGESEPYTLVSKKDATVWNSIKQEDCKTESKKFINNDDVKSGLITGIQWDVVMKFVDQKLDGQGKIFDVKTKDDNRHTGSEAKSGQNLADKVCNIYDLEGNYNDYIAERCNRYSDSPYVKRGGRGVEGEPASFRSDTRGEGTGGYDRKTSFRLVLYVM